MARAPDTIVLKRDRDLEGRSWEIWVRRGLFLLLPLLAVLALLNVFGQRPQSATASSSSAKLKVYAPARVRSGDLFEARFRVTAREELKDAVLVLDPGWLEGMTVNSIAPQPVTEASRNGRFSLGLGHIAAGDAYLLFIYFQTNPTNVGHRSQTVELLDGERKLVTVRHTITIFP